MSTNVTATKKVKNPSILFKVLRNPMGAFSIAWVLLLVVLSIFAPIISPFDPNKTDIYNTLVAPNAEHWLGTDSAGRDVLARLIYGSQFSLETASVGIAVALFIGVIAGLIAGYFGGWFDTLSNWTTSLIMALPGLVVILAAATVLGSSMWIAMAIFGVLLSPAYFRLVYVQVRAVKAELFVDAAKVSGLGDFRIISRHVLGAVRAPVIIQTGVIASIAIAIQSGLLFLGLGDAKEPSWGSSLADGFKKMYNMPTLLAFPSLVIAITTLALAIFANTLRDEIESVDKGRKKTKAGAAVSNAPAKVEVIVHADVARDAKPKLLDVKDLAIGYPDGNGGVKQVVHGITLDIRKGEVMGLIGESGSGKTQTAFSVLGLLPKGGRLVSGSIVFDGVQLSGATAKDYDAVRGGRIAYIPQEPMSNLDPSFSIGTQLIEPMVKVLKISKREARARAVELLERVGIPNPALTMKKFPHEISGGQAQRVLIAGAVSCNPDLIIADEPTTALDVTVQAEVLDLLRDLQAERHMALLLVTHNFGVVADLCDYLNVMKDGQIVESGNVLEIFQNAKHPYTQSLLNSILEGGPARGAYVAPKGDN